MLRHSLTSLAETCHTDQRMLAGFDDTDDPATTPPSQLVKLRGFNCTGNLSASEHKRIRKCNYIWKNKQKQERNAKQCKRM